MKMTTKKIAIIGLGYVGLPLAIEFGKKYTTVGFDINKNRINQLNDSIDYTKEVEKSDFTESSNLIFTDDISNLKSCNFFIVTVPTPIDFNNNPDLTPLIRASETIGSILKKGDIVVYESTVYPGVTEDICVPILQKTSNLIYNLDFFCGYSPERINPGDKKNRLTTIKKVTSGSTLEIAVIIDEIYSSIITAGTYKASSIKVAEAAKVIENAQRDINIAFVNELSKIFNLLKIDTIEVLKAASTKWNFLNFRPGLVGGHCIGVDPYYLAQKAQQMGYHPEIILSGRRINDGMGDYIANELVKLMIDEECSIKNSNVLILGLTFKENCPDIRNTKVIDIYNSLLKYSINAEISDPHVEIELARKEYNINLIPFDSIIYQNYKAIIVAVAHEEFLQIDVSKIKKMGIIIYDVKSIYPKTEIHARL
jgi:UDP-N-acetyl-D-galactosamine dehydrogenase